MRKCFRQCQIPEKSILLLRLTVCLIWAPSAVTSVRELEWGGTTLSVMKHNVNRTRHRRHIGTFHFGNCGCFTIKTTTHMTHCCLHNFVSIQEQIAADIRYCAFNVLITQVVCDNCCNIVSWKWMLAFFFFL